MADIHSELETIEHDPVGKNVKKAIHDALYKVSIDGGEIRYDIAPQFVEDFEPIEEPEES